MVGTGKTPTLSKPTYSSQRHVDITAQPATSDVCLLGPCFLERNEELRMSKDHAQTGSGMEGPRVSVWAVENCAGQDPCEPLAPSSLPWGLSFPPGLPQLSLRVLCSSQKGVIIEGDSLCLQDMVSL